MGQYFVVIPLLDYGKCLCCCCCFNSIWGTAVPRSTLAHRNTILLANTHRTQLDISANVDCSRGEVGTIYLKAKMSTSTGQPLSIYWDLWQSLLTVFTLMSLRIHLPSFFFLTGGKAGEQELCFACAGSPDQLPQLCSYSPHFLPLPGITCQPDLYLSRALSI